MAPLNVLVIGASGGTGQALIRASDSLRAQITVHAFLRTPTKLPEDLRAKCGTVTIGDACESDLISHALEASRAEVAVLAVGAGTETSDVRKRSGAALMTAVAKGTAYENVKVVVVSSLGAGGTKINIGFGVGALVSWMIRHALKDHDNQERVMWEALGEDPVQKSRLMILHPTGLKDGPGKGKAVTFTGSNAPSGQIMRDDLAKWILTEVMKEDSPWFGKAVGVTGAK